MVEFSVGEHAGSPYPMGPDDETDEMTAMASVNTEIPVAVNTGDRAPGRINAFASCTVN